VVLALLIAAPPSSQQVSAQKVSAQQVQAAVSTSEYPADCPEAAISKVDLNDFEWTDGTRANPSYDSTNKNYYVKYKYKATITTKCYKNTTVLNSCSNFEVLLEKRPDFFKDFFGIKPYDDNSSDTCSSTHFNYSDPTYKYSDKQKKWYWDWTETTCTISGSVNSCTAHGSHVHRNQWSMEVYYKLVVPCTECYPYPGHYPYPYPSHYPYPGHYPYPYPYPGHYPYPYPYPSHYPTPEQIPDPVVDTPKVVATSAAKVQQNVDQRIKLQGSITCNNGQKAPCNTPESQTRATAGKAGPYVTSMIVDSFTLTPPSGYKTPKQYKMVSSPVGQDININPKYATMRFYAATRSGAPYSYTASATVSYYMRSWVYNGSSIVWGEPEAVKTVPATLSCTPVSCTFSVIGSNAG
jgi:hypothetical protein